jgi:hypothetical protein
MLEEIVTFPSNLNHAQQVKPSHVAIIYTFVLSQIKNSPVTQLNPITSQGKEKPRSKPVTLDETRKGSQDQRVLEV